MDLVLCRSYFGARCRSICLASIRVIFVPESRLASAGFSSSIFDDSFGGVLHADKCFFDGKLCDHA